MNTTKISRNLFYLGSVFLFTVSLPFSEFMISLSTLLLLIIWLLVGKFREKWDKFKDQPAAILIISIFFVYVIGLIFTHNLAEAIYELKKTAFILVVPLCISTGPAIDFKSYRKIIVSFMIALNVATVIALFRLIFRVQFGIHEIWQILFVSHIGFSFQILLGIVFLIDELYNNGFPISKGLKYFLIGDILYLIVFLFILKSLTGIVAFAFLLVIHLFFVIRNIKSRKLKTIGWVGLPAIILVGFLYLGWCVNHFYDTDKVNYSQLPDKTQNGNLYHHDISNKLLENGHYVGLYVCEEELEKSWNKRSKLQYNQNDLKGFPVSATLIRYLTSKGLTKDSVGVSKLSADDIRNIEKGIANYVYTQRFWSLYPRIYETIWELDVYFKTGNPNLKSLAKRIEFEKAAFTIIREHPFFGVGTGNWKQAFVEAFQKNKSQLDPVQYGSSHNQYLNYLVKFGIFGFIWIMFAWIYPIFLANKHRFYPALMLLLILGIANFSDSNLEAHMGISFFIFFYSLFLFAETKQETLEK